MKIAICFNDLVGSTKGKSEQLIGDFEKCFLISSKLYGENIINKNNEVDIFVHSWSESMKDQILNTYRPKKWIIEKQKTFNTPDYIANTGELRKQSHYSVWYSRKKVVELKRQYEKEHGFKYDCVMLARFDLAWQTELLLESYDMDFFWTQNWPKKTLNGRMLTDLEYWQKSDYNLPFKTEWYGYPKTKDGLLGMWFFSNSKNIDRFAEVYDNLNEYSLPNNCPHDSSGRISIHQQCLYHLEKIGLADKIKFTKNWHDDCPSVRRKYFKEK